MPTPGFYEFYSAYTHTLYISVDVAPVDYGGEHVGQRPSHISPQIETDLSFPRDRLAIYTILGIISFHLRDTTCFSHAHTHIDKSQLSSVYSHVWRGESHTCIRSSFCFDKYLESLQTLLLSLWHVSYTSGYSSHSWVLTGYLQQLRL